MDIERCEKWAAAHHGLLTRDAAVALGVSRSAWYRAIASGRLVLVHQGVARLIGAPVTPVQRIAAAALASGSEAVVSHRSAARLWGVERPPSDPVDICVPRSCGIELEGAVMHRPTDRADLVAGRRSGLRVTNPLRTLCDLGAVEPSGVDAALETLIVSGRVTPDAVRAVVARHSIRGRHGVAALRAAVGRWPLDRPPDSVLEVAMARLLRDHGLPPAEFHPIVEGFAIDFRVTGTPVLIECDGWEFHVADRSRWERDRARDAHLAAAGYVVVRLTWTDIVREPRRTARRLATVLERWGGTQ